jgi:thioredoxin-like negative regulator of GroEL
MSGPVVLISAPWCKRCHELKPDIAGLCAIAGRALTVVNFDELEEDDPMKVAVKSLPTILMDGKSYTAASIEAWKTAVVDSVTLSTGGDDF